MTSTNVRRGLQVDYILGRDISIQWTEAVALVGAACRQIVATSAPGFPVASQVVLYPEGAVVALATNDQHPVRGAAQLLTSLLADDVPVRVRLMLSRATGTDVGYTTLKEFADALAYFERPDAQLVLRALYDRALAAPSRQSADSASPSPMSAPTLAPSSEVPRQARGTHRWAIGATAAALILGLTWFFSPMLGKLRVRAAVVAGSPFETANTPPAPELTAAAARQATNALPGRHEPSGSPSRDPNAGGPPTDPPTLRASHEGAISRGDGWARPPLGSPADAKGPGEYATDVSPVAVNVLDEYATDRERVVYSRTDVDVVPPQSVYPKLPPDRPGVPAAGRTLLDLLISTDGRVERVQLRTPPRDVLEFMLVSAAKSWEFQPALKDGVSVRYRMSIWLAAR